MSSPASAQHVLAAADYLRPSLESLVPCSARMRFRYRVQSPASGEYELHRVYDFAINADTVPADAVPLCVGLEVESPEPLETRLLRASLVMGNTTALYDLVDVEHHRWRVQRNADADPDTQLVWFVFNASAAYPLGAMPFSRQLVLRVVVRGKLGERYNARVPHLYRRTQQTPCRFAPGETALLPTAGEPIVLTVAPCGNRWLPLVMGGVADAFWRPWRTGPATTTTTRPEPRQYHRHHHRRRDHGHHPQPTAPQQPFRQDDKPMDDALRRGTQQAFGIAWEQDGYDPAAPAMIGGGLASPTHRAAMRP